MKHTVFLALLVAGAAHAADYRLQTLEKANATFHQATNAAMYAEAAREYENLVEEENIRNGDLFGALGNAWFMAGDTGRAILNYRRALRYLPGSADLRHNLEAARERCIDLIPKKPPPAYLAWLPERLLDMSAALRGWLFAVCWLVCWGAWFRRGRGGGRRSRIVFVAAGLLSAALMTSLVAESLLKRGRKPGVILAGEVTARKGDGEMYTPAFLEPLHAGTEFQCLETRGDWWRIRLADGQTCWIPARTGALIDGARGS